MQPGLGVAREMVLPLATSFDPQQRGCRWRKDNAAMNFSTLAKMTLTLFKRDTTTKIGVKSKPLKAGWDNDYLQ